MSQDLESALLELESRVDVKSSLDVDGCTYCYDEASLTLLAGPVEYVPPDLLSSLAGEVPDHWGDFRAVYRKFTPAILRALAHDRLHVDEELIAYRLAQAGCWSTWPDSQRLAVLGVLRALLEEALVTYPRRPSLDLTLRMLSTTPEPFTDWLELVDAAPAGAADLHLVDVCRNWLPELADGTLAFGWLDDWLVPDETREWLHLQCQKRLVPMWDRLPEDVRSRIDLLP